MHAIRIGETEAAGPIQRQGKREEAIAVFRELPKKDADSWITHLGMARVMVAAHDKAGAAKEIQKSLSGAPEGQKPMLEGLAKRELNLSALIGKSGAATFQAQCIPIDLSLLETSAYKKFLIERRKRISERLNAFLGTV